MSTYGQRVRALFMERLQPQLGMQVRLDAEGYENDLDRIGEHVEVTFADLEGLQGRLAVLYDGLIASFGGLARTWCNHATLATAYQNAHAFAGALRRLLAELKRERLGDPHKM